MKISRLAVLVLVTGAVVLSAGGVGVASAAPLTCTGTYNNMTLGDVTVPAGGVCRLDSDTVNGNITVNGQLYASSLTVNGALTSNGGRVVQIDSSTITGNMTIANLGNGPADQDSVSIVINDIGGNLIVNGNASPTGDELVSTNTVHGNEADVFNTITGDLAITAETVDGSMLVYKNTGAGMKEVDGNSVSNYLICLANQSPFEASDNSARVIFGNC